MDNGIDVGNLKVAELKAELEERNLSTNGLKKDLAARLQEAIDIDKSDKKNVMEDKVEDQQELAEDKDKVPEAVQDTPEKIRETPIQVEVPLEKEQNGVEQAVKPDQADHTIDKGMAQDQPNNDDPAPPVEMDTKDVQLEENGRTSLGERLIGKVISGGEEEEVEVGDVDFEMEAEVHNEESRAASPPDSNRKQSEIIQDTDRIPSETAPKEKGLSPYSNPPTALSTEEASSSKSLSELKKELAQVEKPSRSVYIVGLVRPLTLPSFRAKAEEYGHLGGDDVEDAQEIWLDGVKTHAYVTYQDEESAVAAKAALSGSVYPPEIGKEIQVYHIPQAIVKQCIAIEEAAWQEDRGKLEMRARVNEETIHYSLHRSETISAAKKLESSLPVSGRSNGNSLQFSNRERRPFGKEQQRFPRSQPNLQWGNSSNRARIREFQTHSTERRGQLEHGHGYRDDRNGGSRHEERSRTDESTSGSSRADQRVRQVEARIRADRERGNRDFNREGHPPSRSDNHDPHSRPRHSDSRWSDHNPPYTRSYDDRHRDHSPPTKSRDFSDRPRGYRSRW